MEYPQPFSLATPASAPDYAHSAGSGKTGRGRLHRLAEISAAAHGLPPGVQDEIARTRGTTSAALCPAFLF